MATDVGCCKQLLYGASSEDEALGKAGIVVRIADPQALSEAIVDLLSDPQKWYACREVGIKRVEKYYDEKIMLSQYKAVYEDALNGRDRI